MTPLGQVEKEPDRSSLSPLHAQKSSGSRLTDGNLKVEIGNHARALMFCMKIDDDAGISLVCSLARAFVAIVKSQSETSHSEREFYKIRRVFKAPKFLREKSA